MRQTITVNLAPTGKSRPRFTRYGNTYTPPKTQWAENVIAAEWRVSGWKTVAKKPLALSVEARFPIPKSWTKAKKKAALAGELLPTVKPDGDNILKLVADALNGVAYADDAQVTEMRVVKMYAAMSCMVITLDDRDEPTEKITIHQTNGG